MPKAKAVPKPGATTINIPPIQVDVMRVRVKGLTPLIAHKFSEKTRKQLLDKSMNKKVKTREAKDPEALFNAARYRVDENGIYTSGDGADAIPARYFKEAMIEAARLIDGVSMVEMRQLIFVEPGVDGIPILNGKGTYGLNGIEPEVDESIQRVGGKGRGTGTPDVRFRPLYRQWGAEFDVHYNANLVGPEEVLNLLNYAGFHCGVCEHRPSKSGGQNGQFQVVEAVNG